MAFICTGKRSPKSLTRRRKRRKRMRTPAQLQLLKQVRCVPSCSCTAYFTSRRLRTSDKPFFGKYGILKSSDIYSKSAEFMAWCEWHSTVDASSCLTLTISNHFFKGSGRSKRSIAKCCRKSKRRNISQSTWRYTCVLCGIRIDLLILLELRAHEDCSSHAFAWCVAPRITILPRFLTRNTTILTPG